jgi:hypothetical protein
VNDVLQRWRLILGEAGHAAGGLDTTAARRDAALDWLYGRDPTGDILGRRAGDQGSGEMTIPEWIHAVDELFPRRVVERLQRDAVEQYGLHELVTDAAVLERIEPNPALLEAILTTKQLMDPVTLALARKLVAKVVRQLQEALSHDVRTLFQGRIDRRRRSLHGTARTFDARRTLAANLRHRDPTTGEVLIQRPVFHGRIRRSTDRWQLILLVDQSGSMVANVIHSAVTASCLWSVPGLKTHLVAFDTEIVDLTEDCEDPVETLMKVQLGGGTDIGRAVRYAADCITTPRRAIVAIVSDFMEGSRRFDLEAEIAALTAQGTVVLGLCALDPNAVPAYDQAMAQRLADRGAHMGVMTPHDLAAFVASTLAGSR